jgi:hypothetical protein
MTRIAFSVSYTLREYLSIVQEHAPTLLARSAAVSGKGKVDSSVFMLQADEPMAPTR